MFQDATNCIISLEGKDGIRQITGKDCLVSSFTVNQTIEAPATIDISLVCSNDSIIHEFFEDKPKRRISKLRVEDCSINELLFAVRQKLKE